MYKLSTIYVAIRIKSAYHTTRSDSDTDYSGISKMIGGDAWDYPFDPKGKK